MAQAEQNTTTTRRSFLARASTAAAGLATAGLICRPWPAHSAEAGVAVTRELLESYNA